MNLKPNIKSIATIAFLSVLAATASADITFGGSKAAGMGGAGLALGNDPSGPGARNPAWYAMNKRSYFSFPQIRYDLSGINFGDLDNFFKASSGGVLKVDDLSSLARTFGDRKVEFGVSLGMGAQFGSYAIDIRGEGAGITNPNQSLKNWVNAGSNVNNVPADAVLDGYGLGTIEIGFSGGEVFKAGEDKLAVGGRLKLVRGYYSHHRANAADIAGNGGGTGGGGNGNGGTLASRAPAPEMNGDDVLNKTGVGLDAGLHWSSSRYPGFQSALLINNLLTPNVNFNTTLPASLSTDDVKPFSRSVDLGFAYDKGPWLAAVDFIDIGGTANMREVRLGGEVHAGRWVAVRAGFGTLTGPTFGVGFSGFNIAVSRSFPVQASYAFRF